MYTGFEFRVFPHASSYRWLNIFRSFEQIIINYFSIFFLQICYYPQLLLFPLPLPCSWIVPKTNIKEFHLRTESEIDKSQFSFICVQNQSLNLCWVFIALHRLKRMCFSVSPITTKISSAIIEMVKSKALQNHTFKINHHCLRKREKVSSPFRAVTKLAICYKLHWTYDCLLRNPPILIIF